MIALLLSAIEAPHDLDFWLGTWNVYVQGQLAGTDEVTASLRGFAVREVWKGVGPGDIGESLFYYMPDKKQWKQVWVTGNGPYKEKLSTPVDGGGIRFSGHVYLPDGRSIADRTTLTKSKDGTVHQVIEQSRDGMHWKVGFDAVYKRSAG